MIPELIKESKETTKKLVRTTPVKFLNDIRFTINTGIGFKPKENESSKVWGEAKGKFRATSGNLDYFLECVGKPYFTSFIIWRNNERNEKNFISADGTILDFDNQEWVTVGVDENGKQITEKRYKEELTLQDALNNPFCKKHGLVYPSSSHSEKWNRFRGVFLFGQTITDFLVYQELTKMINEEMGGCADTSCFTGASGFYGTPNLKVPPDQNPMVLPPEFIEEAKRRANERKEKLEKEKEIRKEQSVKNRDINIDNDELGEILSYISPDSEYDQWTKTGMAIHHFFDGSDDGLDLYDLWSKGGSKYCGRKNIENKWKSFSGYTGVPVTIATLVKFAKENGYKPKFDYREFDKESYRKWQFDQYHELSKFTPDEKFHSRYIAEYFKDKTITESIAIKSAKGTGKTYLMALLTRYATDLTALFIGCRIKLNSVTARVCLATELNMSVELCLSAINGGYNSTIVLDSLMKIAGVDDPSKLHIVIDEIDQVLPHGLLSNTEIKHKRGQILGFFAFLLKHCGRVTLLSADISDRDVELIEQLSGKKIKKIENTYRLTDRTLVLYDRKETLVNKLNALLAEDKRLLVVADSAKHCHALEQMYKGKNKTLVLTAETLGDKPELNRYLENHGVLIAKEEYQLVIFSPVAQSGVSIELDNYFDAVLGFFSHLPPKICRQMLMRDRSNCDRHVYITPKTRGNKFKSCQWETILNDTFELDTYNLSSLALDHQRAFTYYDPIARINYLRYQAKELAYENIVKSRYREIFISECENEGYSVTLYDERGSDDLLKELRAISKSLQQKEAHGIFTAQDINEVTAQKYRFKANLKEKERHELAKFAINEALPNMSYSEMFVLKYWLKDRFKTVRGILNYLLVNNPELAKEIEKIKVLKSIENEDLTINSNDNFLIKAVWDKLDLLSKIDTLWTNETARDFIDSFDKSLRHKLRLLGIKWNKKSQATKVFKSILKLFSFTVVFEKRNKASYYKIIPVELVENEQYFIKVLMAKREYLLRVYGFDLLNFNDQILAKYSRIEETPPEALPSEDLNHYEDSDKKDNIIFPLVPTQIHYSKELDPPLVNSPPPSPPPLPK